MGPDAGRRPWGPWKFFSGYSYFAGKEEARADQDAGAGGIGGLIRKRYKTVD